MSLWQSLLTPFLRQPRRPLSQRQPSVRISTGTVPLGMEATDLELIQKVGRKNDALERTTGHSAGLFFRSAATDIDPMPDDETYAARFHRAFKKKGSTQ